MRADGAFAMGTAYNDDLQYLAGGADVYQNETVFMWGGPPRPLFRRLRAVVGLVLIGFGLAVLLLPRLLEALVAATFILAGLGMLSSLWTWRPEVFGDRAREVQAEVRDDFR